MSRYQTRIRIYYEDLKLVAYWDVLVIPCRFSFLETVCSIARYFMVDRGTLDVYQTTRRSYIWTMIPQKSGRIETRVGNYVIYDSSDDAGLYCLYLTRRVLVEIYGSSTLVAYRICTPF